LKEFATTTLVIRPFLRYLLTLSSRYSEFRGTCLHLQSVMVSEVPAVCIKIFYGGDCVFLRNLSVKLHGVTSQNYIVAILLNAMRTSHSIFRLCSSVRTRNRIPRPYVTKVDLQLRMFRFKPYSRVVAYIFPVLMDRRFRYSGQISSYGLRQICSYFLLSILRVTFHTKAILLNATNRPCVQNCTAFSSRDSCTTRFENTGFNCE